jgi:hypothetical protein
MPRVEPCAKRPARSKVHTVLPGDVHEQVDLYCAHHGISACEFFRRATVEKLAESGGAKQLTRELRAQRRTTRDTQLQSEFNTQLLSRILLLVASSIVSMSKEERTANDRQARALCKAITDQAMQEVTRGNIVVAELREHLPAATFEDAEQRPTRTAVRGGKRTGPSEPRVT